MNRIHLLLSFCTFLVYFQEVISSEKTSNRTWNMTTQPTRKPLDVRGNETFRPKNKTSGIVAPKKTLRSALICPPEKSCAGRCTLNRDFQKRELKLPHCFCDPFCDTVFHDCCGDYDKECNATTMRENSPKTTLDNLWTCTNVVKNQRSIWTIARCKPSWKNDEIAKKCTKPNKGLISTQIPVIDNMNITFQNRYCAICNGIHVYEPWSFKVKCNAVPSAVYTEAESWEFTDYFCEKEFLSLVFATRGRRYCYDVIKTCKNRGPSEYEKNCAQGPTGLVVEQYTQYKNLDCLLCNPGLTPSSTCGPEFSPYSKNHAKIPRPYSAIFTSSTESSFTSYSRCPISHIYDTRSGDCVQLYSKANTEKTSRQQLQKLAITLTYHQDTQTSSCKTLETRFYYVFEKLLKVSLIEKNLTLSNLHIHLQQNTTFTCIVTFQLLGVKDGVHTTSKIDFSKIQKLIFQDSLNPRYRVCRYTLTKHVTREMFCVQNTSYIAVNSSTLFLNGSLLVAQTQDSYRQDEFLKYNETFIVACKNFKPANCSYYNVLQNDSDWILFPDRSIYNHVTKTVFDYGEYSIIDSKVWFCLNSDLVFKANRVSEQTPSTSIHTAVLSYITLVSLSISILSLVAVITVYALNRSLRNLPGKNLMLLCGTLALAQTLWLIESNVSSLTILCTLTAIGSHFAFLSSFCTSGSIAIHSFLTFRRLAKGRLYKNNRKREFLSYSGHSVGLPAVWVTLCWVLDSFKVISLRNENGGCWLGGSEGFNMAFLYPATTQLLFNLIILIITLRNIKKCSETSQQLQEKTEATNKKCVGIYLRMSSLMGLTWLFGGLVVAFPSVVVFEYLFVVGNGFQGLYIALAFLLTKNVKKIVAQRFSKSTETASQSVPSIAKTKTESYKLYRESVL